MGLGWPCSKQEISKNRTTDLNLGGYINLTTGLPGRMTNMVTTSYVRLWLALHNQPIVNRD